VNGRYEKGTRRWTDDNGTDREAPIWRRLPAVVDAFEVRFAAAELQQGKVKRADVILPNGSPLALRLELFPRRIEGHWLFTVVLRNSTDLSAGHNGHECILYQTFFEVTLDKGAFTRYPESRRPFDRLDEDEQSLSLLYRDTAN
jgi:hypothetical protein